MGPRLEEPLEEREADPETGRIRWVCAVEHRLIDEDVLFETADRVKRGVEAHHERRGGNDSARELRQERRLDAQAAGAGRIAHPIEAIEEHQYALACEPGRRFEDGVDGVDDGPHPRILIGRPTLSTSDATVPSHRTDDLHRLGEHRAGARSGGDEDAECRDEFADLHGRRRTRR